MIKQGEGTKRSPTFVRAVFKCHCNSYGTNAGGVTDRDSSVGVATLYGLDGPEIESRWG